MNVLCLGSEVVGAELAGELVRAFLDARFDGGERYVARLRKVEALEQHYRDRHVSEERWRSHDCMSCPSTASASGSTRSRARCSRRASWPG